MPVQCLLLTQQQTFGRTAQSVEKCQKQTSVGFVFEHHSERGKQVGQCKRPTYWLSNHCLRQPSTKSCESPIGESAVNDTLWYRTGGDNGREQRTNRETVHASGHGSSYVGRSWAALFLRLHDL